MKQFQGVPRVRKTVQTVSRHIFAIFCCAAFISTFPAAAQQTGAAGTNGAAAAPAVAERLGKDDGYALSVLYSGDMHGSLETCG
jgi:hypothetical protein